MNPKFIPIIGEISAGKSTFLKSFLGIEVLQTGAVTTTKFICLIKNSNKIAFYHVIPIKEKGIKFEKEGIELINEKEIKQKIKDINHSFEEKKGNQNDIFYMLEAPIKNINNSQLLEKCIFMDIPGLNEKETTYLDDIFDLLTINDILFEIVVFDSTKIGSQSIFKIFEKLQSKNCLKKEGNLYILNKIDECTCGGDGDIIDIFKQYFYEQFQDEKNPTGVEINISKNHFIPLNSLLYQAETKYREDFYSLLLIELFSYIENKNKNDSFIDFLEKRIECIIRQNDLEESDIEDKIEDLNDEDMNNIKEKISDLFEILPDIKKDSSFSLGIDIENPYKEEIKKLYVIHKLKLYKNYFHSKSYNSLQNMINQIILDKNDLASPPCAISIINEKNNDNDDDVLYEMNNFLKENLKNQFESLKSQLKIISENLLGRKIRISFIGNISVGKSTVLNCIIGEKILPTKESECTYRGIIIKHKNINNYLLYKAKLEVIGIDEGYNKYHNYIEDDQPYCEGIEDITSFLKNKNNDKQMNDNDAFLIIHGKLKIFDLIKLDSQLINKIEFVDLPGHNRENNEFNRKEYYNNILQFSNSCIYINDASSVDDEDSVFRIKKQYEKDKSFISPLIRNKFMHSCLFLINKADKVPKTEERNKIIKSLHKTISEVEKDVLSDKMNLCFFSGRYFLDYLDLYKKYVKCLEEEPLSILLYIFEEWTNSWYLKGFKNYTIKIIENIESNLKIPSSSNFSVPDDFNNKLKSAFKELYKIRDKEISEGDQKKMIKKIYNLYYHLKNQDFSKTNYSREFFYKLKDLIIYSDNLQNENLKYSAEEFFQNADLLFNREIKNETEKQKQDNLEKYELFKSIIIPKTEKLLIEKSNKVNEIIKNTKKKCLELIDNEINNVEAKLKDSNNNVKIAAIKLEEKIKKEINEMKNRHENEMKTILDEIIALSQETINTHYNSKNLNLSQIEAEKGKTKNMVITIISSALGGLGTGIGLFAIGSTVTAGIAAGTIGITGLTTFAGSFFGPVGIIGGLAVGGLIFGISMLISFLRKESKYKDALVGSKAKLDEDFKNIQISFLNDFRCFKDSLLKELDIIVDVYHKRINNINYQEWEEIKKKYYIIKEKTKIKLQERLNQLNK